jgi:hypothetical protein
MTRSKMKKLLIGVASLLLACTYDSLTTPTEALLTGKWDLTSVNGSALRYVLSQLGGKKTEVVADTLTMNASNTFTEVTIVRSTQSGQVTTQTIADAGSYSFNSATVTFHFGTSGSIGSGTVTGKTMTVITSGVSFTYKKLQGS